MTSLQEFKWEVCGLVTTNPIHWFVIRCGDSVLNLYSSEFGLLQVNTEHGRQISRNTGISRAFRN